MRWGLLVAMLASGCELIFRPTGGRAVIDADPSQPDADPSQPDADPSQPDAPPPPDAGPPDAVAPDAALCGACQSPDPGGLTGPYFCGSNLDHCNDGPDQLDGHDFCTCALAMPQLFVVPDAAQANHFHIVVASTTVGSLFLQIDGGTCFGTVDQNCGGACVDPAVRFTIWKSIALDMSATEVTIHDDLSCAPGTLVASFTPFN